MTSKRDVGGGPRIFKLDDIDGFYLDEEYNRCYHFTFENATSLVIDIYDTLEAAYEPVGDTTDIIKIDLESGKRVDH